MREEQLLRAEERGVEQLDRALRERGAVRGRRLENLQGLQVVDAEGVRERDVGLEA